MSKIIKRKNTVGMSAITITNIIDNKKSLVIPSDGATIFNGSYNYSKKRKSQLSLTVELQS